MKKVEATIKPFELDDLKDELVHAGIDAMSISEVCSCSADGAGQSRRYRGAAYAADLRPRLKIEILLEDEQLWDCIDAFSRCAKAGNAGAQIIVAPVDDGIRIATGEHSLRAAHAVVR